MLRLHCVGISFTYFRNESLTSQAEAFYAVRSDTFFVFLEFSGRRILLQSVFMCRLGIHWL